MKTYDELLLEYNKLKEEFDEHKSLSEEYEKELEGTNKDLEQKSKELREVNEKLMKECSKLKDDYLNYKEKNLGKMKEIEYLENQVDKLKHSIDVVREEKNSLEKKVIILENDNSDYLNKLRELDSWSEELKTKLEAALEENIILHNENESFKAEMDEAFQRVQEELEEAKNEISAKEKIINRLTNHRDFLLKTAYNVQDDLNNNIINSKSYHTLKTSSSKLNVITPVNNNMKIPEKFMQSYSKTFFNVQGKDNNNADIRDKGKKDSKEKDKSQTDINLKKGISREEFIIGDDRERENFILNRIDSFAPQHENKILGKVSNKTENNHNTKRISTTQLEKYLSRDLKASIIMNDNENDNEDDEDKEFIRQKIDLEIKNILDNRRNFVLNTLIQDNFSFDIVGSSKFVKKNTNNLIEVMTQSKSKLNINSKNQKLAENIDDILSKIQARKEKVLMQKKVLQDKLEKVGIKIC